MKQDRLTYKLHSLFCSMPRYHWDTVNKFNFHNGVHIFFECNEKYFTMDRIVRVGTHTGEKNLLTRLRTHYEGGASIFRTMVGGALLRKNNLQHPHLDAWDNKREERRRLEKECGCKFLSYIENEVSHYMQKHITFTCFRVDSKDERLRLRKGIISTLHLETDFMPSNEWLGLYSTRNKIVKSGLWLQQGLKAEPLSEEEYGMIKKYCLYT